MKKKHMTLLMLAVICLFMITGCNAIKNDSKVKGEVNLVQSEYSILINQTITIYDDLSIQLFKINDSRCPKDVDCYWEGELEYELLINGSSYKISTILNKQIDLQKYIISIVVSKCDYNTLTINVEKIR